MLYFSRWKVIAILLTAAVVCGFTIPNFFPEQVAKTWPAWAQRRLVLGLDLQGGSQILLEVDLNDVRKQRLEALRDEVRRTLRDSRISWTTPADRARQQRRGAAARRRRLPERARRSCASCRSRSAACSRATASAPSRSPMPAAA